MEKYIEKLINLYNGTTDRVFIRERGRMFFIILCGVFLLYIKTDKKSRKHIYSYNNSYTYLLFPNRSMYIFGGFSSVLLNDILVYKPPNCEAFRDEELCKNARPGIRCLWNKKHCESWESGHANNILRAKCPKKTGKWILVLQCQICNEM